MSRRGEGGHRHQFLRSSLSFSLSLSVYLSLHHWIRTSRALPFEVCQRRHDERLHPTRARAQPVELSAQGHHLHLQRSALCLPPGHAVFQRRNVRLGPCHLDHRVLRSVPSVVRVRRARRPPGRVTAREGHPTIDILRALLQEILQPSLHLDVLLDLSLVRHAARPKPRHRVHQRRVLPAHLVQLVRRRIQALDQVRLRRRERLHLPPQPVLLLDLGHVDPLVLQFRLELPVLPLKGGVAFVRGLNHLVQLLVHPLLLLEQLEDRLDVASQTAILVLELANRRLLPLREVQRLLQVLKELVAADVAQQIHRALPLARHGLVFFLSSFLFRSRRVVHAAPPVGARGGALDPPQRPQLVQRPPKLPLVIQGDEVRALAPRPEPPRHVDPIQQPPARPLQPQFCREHGQCGHRHPRLRKLHHLQRSLPYHVGAATEQHVPEIVHLPHPERNVRKLGVAQRPHRRPFVRPEVALPHEPVIRPPERVRRVVLQGAHHRVRDRRPVPQNVPARLRILHPRQKPAQGPLPGRLPEEGHKVGPPRVPERAVRRHDRGQDVLQW
mmetsp:Transcript_9020/g.24285  ORF Transcript_9020/g.24285 Transcript_9020/m.24285 type:complete len:555 (+) Transcript_9020:3247-4911(+)